MTRKLSCLFAALFALLAPVALAASADSPSITIDASGELPIVTLETSVYTAVIRVNPGGGDFGNEHAIRDWTLKSFGIDQVDAFIDACAQRGPLKNARLVSEDADSKTVRLEYSGKPDEIIAVSELTIYRDSPVIRIDYLQYPSWTNTVDIGAPGGLDSDSKDWKSRACTRVHGQKEYKEKYGRDLVFHEESYWNTFDEPQKDTDPVDGGPLNYNGHLIMAVADLESGIGFGRVMPVKTPGKGGISILKLLWNQGFECFAATGDDDRPSYTGYIYVFATGLDEAMKIGRHIADGDMLSGSCLSGVDEQGERTVHSGDWWKVDEVNHTVENDVIAYGYGEPDFKMYPTHRSQTAITSLVIKSLGEDQLKTLGNRDGYIDSQMGAQELETFRFLSATDDCVEVEVDYRCWGRAAGDCRKIERVYKGLGVIEMDYVLFENMNWEDCVIPGQTEDVAFYLYGSDIPDKEWKAYSKAEREEGEEPLIRRCVESHGGDWEAVKINGCYIYGYYNTVNGRGVGCVIPADISDEWKLWHDDDAHRGIGVLEAFPWIDREPFPFKRWVYVVTGGREEMERTGKAIATSRGVAGLLAK
mgnify:CR=1 FL=1